MTTEKYSDAEILEVAKRMRACKSLLEWNRVAAYLIRDVGASEAASTRLMWGLATGYRKPPTGLEPVSDVLTWGEEYCIKLYLKNYQNDISNAAAFLGLTVEAYRAHMERLKAQGRPTLTDQ